MGHPVLRRRARALERADLKSAGVQKLIDDMIDTMAEYHGIGLAAPQVHEGVRIFIAGMQEDAGDDERGAGNHSRALRQSRDRAVWHRAGDRLGGLPEHSRHPRQGPSARARQDRGLDREGTRLELQLAGFPARVVQHENDHLDGVLFLDRMTSFETLTFLDEYGRHWRD